MSAFAKAEGPKGTDEKKPIELSLSIEEIKERGPNKKHVDNKVYQLDKDGNIQDSEKESDDDSQSDTAPDLITTESDTLDDSDEDSIGVTIGAISAMTDGSDEDTNSSTETLVSLPPPSPDTSSGEEHYSDAVDITGSDGPDEEENSNKDIMRFIMTLFKLDKKSKKVREESLDMQDRFMNKSNEQAKREKQERLAHDASLKQYVKEKKSEFDNRETNRRPKTGVELLFSITKELENSPPPEEGIASYLNGIISEMKRQDEHKRDKSCNECEPPASEQMLEIEGNEILVGDEYVKPPPSKTEMATKIRKALRKINKDLKKQSEKECVCGSEGHSIAPADADLNLARRRKKNDLSEYHKDSIGVHPSQLGGRTRLLSDVNDALAMQNTNAGSIRLQLESYWDAAYRLGPDGLAKHRKKVEKDLIADMKDLMADRNMSDVIDEVCDDAKDEYKRYKEMEAKIKARSRHLKNPEEWKTWSSEHVEKQKEKGAQRARSIHSNLVKAMGGDDDSDGDSGGDG